MDTSLIGDYTFKVIAVDTDFKLASDIITVSVFCFPGDVKIIQLGFPVGFSRHQIVPVGKEVTYFVLPGFKTDNPLCPIHGLRIVGSEELKVDMLSGRATPADIKRDDQYVFKVEAYVRGDLVKLLTAEYNFDVGCVPSVKLLPMSVRATEIDAGNPLGLNYEVKMPEFTHFSCNILDLEFANQKVNGSVAKAVEFINNCKKPCMFAKPLVVEPLSNLTFSIVYILGNGVRLAHPGRIFILQCKQFNSQILPISNRALKFQIIEGSNREHYRIHVHISSLLSAPLVWNNQEWPRSIQRGPVGYSQQNRQDDKRAQCVAIDCFSR